MYKPLRILIFLGSAKIAAIPGTNLPTRLGNRVSKYYQRVLTERKHEVHVIDPMIYKVSEILNFILY